MAFISKLKDHYTSILTEIDEQGLTKTERIIITPQGAAIKVNTGEEVLNFCANNYLGLADNKEIIEEAKRNMDSHGFGMSSVRFICGTQDIHKQLESKISTFLKKEDTILYSSCFDANAGLFETILSNEDAIVSDELNHASIIDGVRLCKAMRYRYKNSNMEDLRAQLDAAKKAGARHIMIATDGVFSMDGYIAKLDQICDIADEYGAMVMVDDSHATGFVGKTGRGSAEHCGVLERVDIITSTLGKALGGASGGFTAAPKEIVSLLRQRSRPYLFSNTLTPSLTAAGIKVLEKLSATTELRDKLEENTKYFREKMKASGFEILDSVHPIVPIMLYHAKLANTFADEMLKEGVYVIGFSFPVVPREKARIRVQISAGHNKEQLDKAIEGFIRVGKRLGVIKD